MNAFEITQSVTLLANYIACQCPEKIELFAVFFAQLGDTLATIAVVNGACEKKQPECRN